MAKRFKFRFVNEITGGFVIGVLVLLVAGIVFTARAQKWFSPVRKVSIALPEEGSMGLRKDAEVRLLGSVVGSVDDIIVGDDGRMKATVKIREEFFRFVRADSVAIIKKTLGFAGDAFIEITRGRGAELPKIGATLQVGTERGATEVLQEVAEQVKAEAVPAVKQTRQLIEQTTLLISDLRDPKGPVQQTLSSVQRIMTGLEKGEGVAGKLLRDPALAAQVDSTIPKLTAMLDELQGILKDVRKTTATLPEIAGTTNEQLKRLPEMMAQTQAIMKQVEGILQDMRKMTAGMPQMMQHVDQTVQSLPGLTLQTQETLRQMQRLIEGFQRHWLVRSYIDQSQPSERISPESAGGGIVP